MHLTARIKRNLFIAFAVTLVSVGVVFTTAGAQGEPESIQQAEITGQLPASGSEALPARRIAPEIEASPALLDAAAARKPAVPKSAKALALAEALANGETLPPAAAETEAAEQAAAPQAAVEQLAAPAPAPQDAAADAAQIDETGVPDDLVLLDTFIATAYCLTGTTSTGTYTTVGRTLAVNPGVIPYGTHVWIYLDDGTFVGDYYAEDTGSNMMEHPYVVDIYMGEDSYDACINWGAQHVSIYVERE